MTWLWLESTRELQQQTYGVDYAKLHGAALADYLIWNCFALEDEIHEFMGEVQWKTWAVRRGEVRDRSAAVDELVDVGHFLANALVAMGVSDAEWEERYQAKQQRNMRRQQVEGGYDTQLAKCPRCRRELDKPGAVMRIGTTRHCAGAHCHELLP